MLNILHLLPIIFSKKWKYERFITLILGILKLRFNKWNNLFKFTQLSDWEEIQTGVFLIPKSRLENALLYSTADMMEIWFNSTVFMMKSFRPRGSMTFLGSQI